VDVLYIKYVCMLIYLFLGCRVYSVRLPPELSYIFKLAPHFVYQVSSVPTCFFYPVHFLARNYEKLHNGTWVVTIIM